MTIKRSLLVILLCLHTFGIVAGTAKITDQDITLMPLPDKLEIKDGKFRLQKTFKISLQGVADPRLSQQATRFLRRLDRRTGLFFNQEMVDSNLVGADMQVKTKERGVVEFGMDEAYRLLVTRHDIELTASSDIGALRGLETLLQLLQSDDEGYYFPAVQITDKPRFPWRGLMIDVARHFQPVHVIKRNLDAMAAVKMNVLHLHLVDDQGFRVESKVLPELHQKASDGLYYTQDQIKEIIHYADQLGIRVYPEFDVPGHATSWLVAFPELASAPGPYSIERHAGIFDPTLDPTNEKTYEILNKLFIEMAALFPDEYFHIGGDENEGHHWDNNPRIQAFMKENGIKDNHELQTYFNKRILGTLSAAGKKMMGWDEILQPNLPKSTVIHSWRGQQGLVQAASQGFPVILSNGFYIDLMKPAAHHYLTDPLPPGVPLSDIQKKNVLGGEATMWSELVTEVTIDSRIWPRTAAIAERLWSPGHRRDIEDMYSRLDKVCLLLEEHGLTHMSSKDMILRNIAAGHSIEPLKTLTDVVEPLKGYTRNPGGTMYKSYSPFTLFADAATADAPAARRFNQLVRAYINDSTEVKAEIEEYLKLWEGNHDKLLPIISKSPALKPIEQLSADLSSAAKVGLSALSHQINYDQAMSELETYKRQGGRTTLQIIESIQQLVKKSSITLHASYTLRRPSVDGDLADWSEADWQYFLPFKHADWSDSCHYAITWDENNLYLAFRVNNNNLQAKANKRDQSGLHMDDGIEVLIDAAFDRSPLWQPDDMAYHVNVSNIIFDEKGTGSDGAYNHKWNGRANTAVKISGSLNDASDTDKGYYVEMAISWKEIGKTPSANLTLGINLAVNDRDDYDQSYRYYDLMNLAVFHRPDGFAKLILTDSLKEQSSLE